MMKKKMTEWISVFVMVMMVAPGFATVINYEFESGSTAVDSGGGGFDSALVGSGMAVVNTGAKFGSGSLRTDGNTIVNYTLISNLTDGKAALNTEVSNFSFSTFFKADSVTSGKISAQQTLFTRRANSANKAGEFRLVLRTDGKLQFTAFHADGSSFSPISTAAFSLTENAYSQLGVTYDAALDQVKYYVDGVQLGTTISVTNIAAIPAISSVPTTAYIRFAMDTTANAGGMNYDNIIYDTDIIYTGDQMASIYSSGIPFFEIARQGVPQRVIRVPSTRTNLLSEANTLAGVLQKITGGSFSVEMFDPAVGPDPGIILGLSTNLNLADEVPDPGANMKIRERYLIATANNNDYLFLVGATDMAVRHAMYDLLYRLECRWFFASTNWTVFPSDENLLWTTPVSPLRTKSPFTMGAKSITMKIYADELPDFKMRKFSSSSAANRAGWEQTTTNWNNWAQQNRVSGAYVTAKNSSYDVVASHSYGNIITWIKSEGLWSDSFYPLIDDVRITTNVVGVGQLCLSNTNLQQRMTEYAVNEFTDTPTLDCVSLSPNDGGGWCQCAACRAIQDERSGFITDRMITSANQASASIPSGKYLGVSAYYMQAAPPSMAVNSNVYVNIATRFLTYGSTVNGLIADWSAKAQNLGIRDYLSIAQWDWNLPGKADAANLGYIDECFPYYYNHGADSYDTGCSLSWGPFGLGYYVAAKKLWNTEIDAVTLEDDFFSRCFGAATNTMISFYDRLDPANHYQVSADLVGRLYGYIQTARGQETNEAVVARLDDLTLYVRYIELFRASGLGETVLTYVWKIRDTDMVDSLQLWRRYDWDVGEWPEGCGWDTPASNHPWKVSGTYSHEEIIEMMTSGIANNPLLHEEPRLFSDELVPSGAAASTRGDFQLSRGTVHLALRAGTNGVIPSLEISDGWVYSTKGPAYWELYDSDGITLLESGTIPEDKTTNTVTFSSSGAGNYFFAYDDNTAGSKISWAAGKNVSYFALPGKSLWQSSRVNRRYFYVPADTQWVAASAENILNCNFYRADSTLMLAQPQVISGGLTIEIGPLDSNDVGQVWYVTGFGAKNFMFLTVPGLMAANADELLVPAEALP